MVSKDDAVVAVTDAIEHAGRNVADFDMDTILDAVYRAAGGWEVGSMTTDEVEAAIRQGARR